jgi:hypothetical protein
MNQTMLAPLRIVQIHELIAAVALQTLPGDVSSLSPSGGNTPCMSITEECSQRIGSSITGAITLKFQLSPSTYDWLTSQGMR